MTVKLSVAMDEALRRFSYDEPRSAYTAQTSSATIEALVKRGLLRDVTKRGPGGLFSPRTHYRYLRVKL